MSVATGLAIGSTPKPELAQRAVLEAMQRCGLEVANSVLLFLTSEFARDPLPAIKAASRAANCVQVVGCSAPGIFTDQDWVIDAPAAAVMVFGGPIYLSADPAPRPADLLLALAAPNALNITWLAAPGRRFGGVSGDATGQGPFSVWQGGKAATAGHCELALHGVTGVVGAAHGVRILTDPKPVTAGQGHDILFLGGKPVLDTLQQACGAEPLPLHRLMAGIADESSHLMHGQYRLVALVGASEAERSVTLAHHVEPGQRVFWAVREPEAAQADLDATVAALEGQLPGAPDFGLLFSCLGRGPYFYSGIDRDLELLQRRHPGMPLIGFYGNGEIAPINGMNELLQYSAVLGLFHVQP
ncbi:MAG: FIST C-terminal domain-containing protein [Methylophilaceae bacterium]|nr:FIST C-terminal domain-containing protein [Methylophilaceae bacterium]